MTKKETLTQLKALISNHSLKVRILDLSVVQRSKERLKVLCSEDALELLEEAVLSEDVPGIEFRGYSFPNVRRIPARQSLVSAMEQPDGSISQIEITLPSLLGDAKREELIRSYSNQNKAA